MYLGEIVELLPADAFHEGTLHPYSRALVEAVLIPDPRSSGTESTYAWAETFQAPRTHPRGAGSIRGVRTSRSAA